MKLPPLTSGEKTPSLRDFSQLTLVGANGSGKTRFMNWLIKECGEKAYVLSALSAFYPERKPSHLKGSIDDLYGEMTGRSSWLRADAVSEFDKLVYMLISDECNYLLRHKSKLLFEDADATMQPTKLDRIIEIWQELFPGNQILRHSGRLLFSTGSGESTVDSLRLSQGEKTAFYYIAAVLYAMPDACIFIDSPTFFLHPAIQRSFWNTVEQLRPDCRFIYNTYDVEFVNTRTRGVCIWVKSFNADSASWSYQFIRPDSPGNDMLIELLGTRKPVLFIEGDSDHSIDGRLYALIFNDFTVRPLGSCNKVIETTRSFNDAKGLHHLDSYGIVDRDRRQEQEVAYLRRKNIYVPDVAEVENLFLLEDVIKVMANLRGRDAQQVFAKVKKSILKIWRHELESQILIHVRHRMKRLAEYRIDGRFNNIGELKKHISRLPAILNVDGAYQEVRQQFNRFAADGDYEAVLKVFNFKPVLGSCGVAQSLGYSDRDSYINGVIDYLKKRTPGSTALRNAFRRAFRIEGKKESQQQLLKNEQTAKTS